MICTVTDSIDFSQQITKCNPCFNFCAIDWRRYTTLKEETFAVSRFLAKSAKVYSREIFQKTSSAKVSSREIF